MLERDHVDADDGPSPLALVTMLSKAVYRATVEREGSSTNLKTMIALSYLRELGSVSQRYLGGILCLDANNTVLLLNELEGDGLVLRRRDPEDRRRHVVELTEAGLELLRQTELRMFELEDDLLAALAPEERSQLRALLHRALYDDRGVSRRATAHVV